MLTLIDEYSRQCLKIHVDRALKSKDVLDALAESGDKNGVAVELREAGAPVVIDEPPTR